MDSLPLGRMQYLFHDSLYFRPSFFHIESCEVIIRLTTVYTIVVDLLTSTQTLKNLLILILVSKTFITSCVVLRRLGSLFSTFLSTVFFCN